MKKAKEFIVAKIGEKNAKIVNVLSLVAIAVILLNIVLVLCSHCWKHNYIATVTEPTCLTDGYTTYVCEKCGDTYTGDNTPALGHDFVLIEEQKATCTENGWEAYHKCSRCGAASDYVEITATGHTPDGNYYVKSVATPSKEGVKAQKCVDCGAELTEVYTLSEAETKSWYKNNCKSYSYEEIFRNANSHMGEYVKFTGEVIQVINGYGSYTLRVNVTKAGNYSTYYTDTIMISIDADDVENGTKILEDDIVTFYGKAAGTYTYTSVLGASVEVPLMLGEYAVIN